VPAAEKREVAEKKRDSRPKAKLSFKDTRELEALPDRIAALESEQAALNARLADPALYRGAPEEVRTLRERLAALDEEIAQAMLRWEELESRAG
jgi:ATP-binding cassette subfamily F protein uup